MYVVGVSKAYSNSNSRVKNRIKPKTDYVIYSYDEHFKISRKSVSKLQWYFAKLFTKKYHKITFKCENCSQKFISIVKNKKKSVRCPNCEM